MSRSCSLANPTRPGLMQSAALLLLRRFRHEAARECKWQKPQNGYVKLNFDGASKAGSRSASIGGVFRDHKGLFLFGFAEPIGKATSCMAELMAAKRGLELALENDWLRLWMEGDAKVVVDLLMHGKTFGPKEVQGHAKDIKGMLLEMDAVKVSHVYREGNRVADRLADIGYEYGVMKTWWKRPEDERLERLIREDVEGKVVWK